eukprot:1142191-Pelagomonas_calceolata.AAC.11
MALCMRDRPGRLHDRHGSKCVTEQGGLVSACGGCSLCVSDGEKTCAADQCKDLLMQAPE